MLLWTVSIVIGVIALIGVLLVPGRTRIEQNDDLEGYERRWKFIVYIIGFVVIGGAAFLVLELLVLKALEAGELWAKIDMGLFVALGLGIIVYNAYTAKLIVKMRTEGGVEEPGPGEEAQTETEGAVMMKKVTGKAKRSKSVASDEGETGSGAECPACGEPFAVGAKACDSCGAEFEYDDGGHEGAVMTEKATEVEEVGEEADTGSFECPSCGADNKVGDKNCSGCGAEFDYE
jgi:predicted RNA-binding Zn-ribbon protein involved in translation (DUF1610 family)